MSPQLAEVEPMALKLNLADRATLAKHLISSLDRPSESENEALWLDEADRRYQSYRSGTITARPAADVLADARAVMPLHRQPNYWTSR